MSYAHNENQFTQEELDRMRADQKTFNREHEFETRSENRNLIYRRSVIATSGLSTKKLQLRGW